jgi:hypothetical protein
MAPPRTKTICSATVVALTRHYLLVVVVIGDVPLFVEHCEATVAEVDVTLRWLDE